MGWYYNNGGSRKNLIEELTAGKELTTEQGVVVTTSKIASCYRGGIFSGVLWTVWQRTFAMNGIQVEPTQRWISCDLMRCDNGNWGYKPLDESMHPFYYSCPLGYFTKVPIDQYGGNAEWRECVKRHHEKQAEKRQQRRIAAR